MLGDEKNINLEFIFLFKKKNYLINLFIIKKL